MNALRIVLVTLLLNCCWPAYSQDSTAVSVLKKATIGKEYSFKREGTDVEKLKYLGSLKDKKGNLFKVINSTYISGLYESSKRASCKVLIYDKANKYLGYYFVGDIWSLPAKAQGSNLVFMPSKYCKEVTKISFADGIPKEIFVFCNGKEGDLYDFYKK